MKRGEPPKWSYCKEGGTFGGCLLPSNAGIATRSTPALSLAAPSYQSSRRILKHPCLRGKTTRGAHPVQLLSIRSTSGVRLRGAIELREVQGRGQLMRITLASELTSRSHRTSTTGPGPAVRSPFLLSNSEKAEARATRHVAKKDKECQPGNSAGALARLVKSR